VAEQSMAEPLKNSFGADVPRTIARMIAAVSPRFDEKAFVRSVLDGYDESGIDAARLEDRACLATPFAG